MKNPKIKLRMATWSFRIGHIYVKEEVELPNGKILPCGILCDHRPTKLLSKKLGTYFVLFPLGSVHVSNLPVCKNCISKAQKYCSDVIADILGLTGGSYEPTCCENIGSC